MEKTENKYKMPTKETKAHDAVYEAMKNALDNLINTKCENGLRKGSFKIIYQDSLTRFELKDSNIGFNNAPRDLSN